MNNQYHYSSGRAVLKACNSLKTCFNAMDTFQELDISQLLFEASVSNVERLPTSSGCNDTVDQKYTNQGDNYLFNNTAISNIEMTSDSSGSNDILDYKNEFSPLSVDTKPAPFHHDENACDSSGSNDILDYINQFSPLWVDTKPIPFYHDENACENNYECVEVKTEPLCSVENACEPVSNVPLTPTSSDSKEKKKTAVFTCISCKKIFHRKGHLNRHTLIHEKKKINTVYTCSLCKKIFSRNCNLMQHMPIHEKENYTCLVCNITFPRRCYLKQHKMIHERNSSIFDCVTCGKTFSCNAYLKRHMKIHTREKVFSCKVCLEAFSSKFLLKRHQLVHKNNEKMKRLFKCEYCAYTFSRDDQLKHHQNSICTCADCNQKFCRDNDLNVHIQKYHSPELSQIFNPYSEKVKYFKRKNELTECSTTTFENYKDSMLDMQTYLNSLYSAIENEMKYQFFEKNYFKCWFMMEALITTSLNNEEREFHTLNLNSNIILIFSENMIPSCIKLVFTQMINEYTQLKTDWNLNKIKKLDIFTIKCITD